MKHFIFALGLILIGTQVHAAPGDKVVIGPTLGFGNISTAGQAKVAASKATDTLKLVAGSGVTITTNSGTKSVTLSSTGMSDAERTKLNGIQTGATANSSDAALLSRSNHTGTQAISTVSGLQTALDSILLGTTSPVTCDGTKEGRMYYHYSATHPTGSGWKICRSNSWVAAP